MAPSKMMRFKVIVLALTLLAGFGCVYGRGLTYTEGGTLLGALYGAGIGAAIGSASGHAGEGAGIGGLVGSLIGGSVGYSVEGDARYGRGDPYHDPYYDPYYDRYYDPYYYNHPSHGDRTYRRYSGPPPVRDPYNRPDPAYEGQAPGPSAAPDEEYGPADSTSSTYSEDYYQKQNRRLMSPGYDVR
jgi:hypothetical protein